MALVASHAAMVAPLQAITEFSLGFLLVVGLLTRPAAFVAFLFLGTLWVTEWGTSWIWELLAGSLHRLGLWWDARAGLGALTRSWRGVAFFALW